MDPTMQMLDVYQTQQVQQFSFNARRLVQSLCADEEFVKAMNGFFDRVMNSWITTVVLAVLLIIQIVWFIKDRYKYR